MRKFLRHKRAIIASLAVLGMGLTATYAAFTDTAETTATITAAGVDVVVNGDVSDGSPVKIPITLQFQPDGKYTWGSYQDINVRNNSAQPIAVTIAAPTVTDLAGAGLADQIDASFNTYAAEGWSWVGQDQYLPLSTVGQKVSTVSVAASKQLTIQPGAECPVTLYLRTPSGLTNTYQNASVKVDWTITATVA